MRPHVFFVDTGTTTVSICAPQSMSGRSLPTFCALSANSKEDERDEEGLNVHRTNEG